MRCNICPRQCSIDRVDGIGYCGMTNNLKVAKVGRFDWEEPIISGTRGSGAIFFSGCNLRCSFCQNYQISSEGFGKIISVERLAQIFCELENLGVHNINLVSPTQFTEQIIQALDIYKPNIPVVWNSNGYENVDTLKKLRKYIDIFLVDCKFANAELSNRFCHAVDYPEVNKKCILEMLEQQPVLKYSSDSTLSKGVIIRHLVMPNCTKDSKLILDYLINIKDRDYYLSLMGQYTPYYLARNDEMINRKLRPLEYKAVISYVQKLGFEKVFIQDLTSATEDYIPNWDLSGV